MKQDIKRNIISAAIGAIIGIPIALCAISQQGTYPRMKYEEPTIVFYMPYEMPVMEQVPTESEEPEQPTTVAEQPPTEPETSEQPTEAIILYDVPLSDELQIFISGLCEERNIPFEIVLSVIEQESTYMADVMGDGGNAYGLMQIHPQWHQARMDELGYTDLLNPYENVAVGIDYLAELANEGKGQAWMLMAYNGGADYADKLLEQGVTSEYALEVIDRAENLERKGE